MILVSIAVNGTHVGTEHKVDRDQGGLHIRIPYRKKTLWGSYFRRPLGWTLSNPFSFANLVLEENNRGGKNRGKERRAESMLLLHVRENMDSSSSSAVWGLRYLCVRHTAAID